MKRYLAAVKATRRLVSSNSNLGMILLISPLATAANMVLYQRECRQILDGLTADDARLTYEAIRLARPGGLGSVKEADVHSDAPSSLIDAMRLAADRDLVARQYANGFREVFDGVVRCPADVLDQYSLLDAIVLAYLAVMAKYPDSLIAQSAVARRHSVRRIRPRRLSLLQRRDRKLGKIAWPTSTFGSVQTVTVATLAQRPT